MDLKKFGKFLGIFLVYFLTSSVIVLLLNIVGIKYSNFNNNELLMLNIASDLLICIFLYIIYRKYLIEKFVDFKKNFKSYFDIGLKAWGIGLLIMYVSNILIYVFSPVKEAANESAVQDLITASPILAFIFTTILAPFIEELIFRKSIQDIFKKQLPFIITSGFIFGLLHVMGSESIYDFIYIIPYGALGASFAYALSKTDNIYTTIMIHSIHNGLLTLIYIFL